MKIEERKKLVLRLLQRAHAKAEEEAQIIRCKTNPTVEFVHSHLHRYILAKFMLPEDCEEDDLRTLVELSLSRTTKLDPKLLKELDKATTCDKISSASAKKIMLLYAMQKDLGVHPNAAELTEKKTVAELARLMQSLLIEKQKI